MSRQIPAPAAWLGGVGLIPFAIAASVAVIAENGDVRLLAVRAFVAYSAVMMAFLGGIRWGAALGDVAWRPLILSILPGLLAAACMLMDVIDAIKILALLYAVVGLFDVMRRPAPEWPAWFMKLRARLSGAVVVVHLVLWLAWPGQA